MTKFIIQRPWRERLFALPWRPWVRERTATEIERICAKTMRVDDTHVTLTRETTDYGDAIGVESADRIALDRADPVVRTFVSRSEQQRRDMRAAERAAGMVEPALRVPLDRK